MTDYDVLLEEYKQKLKKALLHLNYSYQKIQKLPMSVSKLTEEELEVWEGFIARFGRATDFFITKYLKTYILRQDPAFEGTVRDILNQAEKLGLIDSAYQWLDIRSLRNKAAHDYDDEKLEETFQETKKLAPIVLNVKKDIK